MLLANKVISSVNGTISQFIDTIYDPSGGNFTKTSRLFIYFLINFS